MRPAHTYAKVRSERWPKVFWRMSDKADFESVVARACATTQNSLSASGGQGFILLGFCNTFLKKCERKIKNSALFVTFLRQSLSRFYGSKNVRK
jgi:hypothetical protein